MAAATLVLIVTVAVTAVLPLGVTVAGEKVQVLAAGNPESLESSLRCSPRRHIAAGSMYRQPETQT